MKSLANAFESVGNDDNDDSDSESEESEEEDLEEAPLDLLDDVRHEDAITTSTTVEMTEVGNNAGSQNQYYTTTTRGKGGPLDMLDDARHEDHSVGIE